MQMQMEDKEKNNDGRRCIEDTSTSVSIHKYMNMCLYIYVYIKQCRYIHIWLFTYI